VELSVSLGDPPWLTLRGRDPLPEQARPGDTLTIAWYWQVLEDAPPAGTVHVSLVDPGSGSPVQEVQFPIGSSYPTSQWTAGQWMVTRDDLRLDQALPAGTYDLRGQVESGGFVQPVDAGTIGVLGWPRQYQLPASVRPTEITFGDDLKLVGYDLPDARAGQTLAATLCWQALREMATSYVTFAHLVDAQGAVVSQVDMVPDRGAQPTTGWLTGEVVCSDYDLALPANLVSGDYSLAVGIYEPRFEERLPATGPAGTTQGDQALLAITIGP
jgi:hypothetical protein